MADLFLLWLSPTVSIQILLHIVSPYQHTDTNEYIWEDLLVRPSFPDVTPSITFCIFPLLYNAHSVNNLEFSGFYLNITHISYFSLNLQDVLLKWKHPLENLTYFAPSSLLIVMAATRRASPLKLILTDK